MTKIAKSNHETLRKLKTLLSRASLIKPDKEYVESLIGLVEKDKNHDQEFISALELLLTQNKIVKFKYNQRMSAEPFDLFRGRLRDFSRKELESIASNICAIQMTDGCTVGCPWCGLNAKGFIKSKISYDSFKKFINEYGQYFPKNKRAILYWASDPFDWYEGDFSYFELAKLMLKKTRVILSTVTALPEGTEFTVLRYLEYLGKRFSAKQLNILNDRETRCFNGPINSHGAVLLRTVRKDQKINAEKMLDHWLITQRRPLELRFRFNFSVSKKNVKRVKAVLTILEKKKISNDFSESFLLINRDISPEDTVLKVGRAFDKNKKRNIGENLIGIGCFDGILLTPDKFVGMTMEAVTSDNPTGVLEEKITPGLFRVPQYNYVGDYETASISGKNRFGVKILPPVRYQYYRNGQLVKKLSNLKIEREILTYALIWERIIPLLQAISNSLKSSKELGAFKKYFLKEVTERESQSMRLFRSPKIKNGEKETVLSYISKIKKWAQKPIF